MSSFVIAVTPLTTGLFCSASALMHHPIYPHCCVPHSLTWYQIRANHLINAYCTKLTKFFTEKKKIEILHSHSLVYSVLFPFANFSLGSRMNDLIATKPCSSWLHSSYACFPHIRNTLFCALQTCTSM